MGFDQWLSQHQMATIAHQIAQQTTARIHEELAQLTGDDGSGGAVSATADVMQALAQRRADADAALTDAKLALAAVAGREAELAEQRATVDAREAVGGAVVAACVGVRVHVCAWVHGCG